jgi:hypothetical protein
MEYANKMIIFILNHCESGKLKNIYIADIQFMAMTLVEMSTMDCVKNLINFKSTWLEYTDEVDIKSTLLILSSISISISIDEVVLNFISSLKKLKKCNIIDNFHSSISKDVIEKCKLILDSR